MCEMVDDDADIGFSLLSPHRGNLIYLYTTAHWDKYKNWRKKTFFWQVRTTCKV